MSQSQAMSICAPSGATMLASEIRTSRPSISGIRASARCSSRMHARQNLQGVMRTLMYVFAQHAQAEGFCSC